MIYFTTALLTALLPLVDAAPLAAREVSALDVSDRYLVSLKPTANVQAHKTFVDALYKRSLLERRDAAYQGVRLDYDFGSFKGYAGHFDKETIDAIKANNDVELVEPQKIYHTSSLTEQTRVPSWGLAYVSTKKASGTSYFYDESAGSGVTAYVVDTGINIKHATFGGRAKWGTTVAQGASDTDANGHGTHVAGTIVGSNFGIAKAAQVVAVKVLSDEGSGSNSDVIEGIQWAVRDATSKGLKAVINLSLGGEFSKIVNDAVESAIDQGVNVVVAAGNEATDASTSSPASAKKVLTIGATARDNKLAYYSNFGPAVDLLAPGSNITSAWYNGKNSTKTISGTSMASPHVAGLVAYLRALEGLTSADAANRVVSLATSDLIKDVPSGTVNLFSYNGSGK